MRKIFLLCQATEILAWTKCLRDRDTDENRLVKKCGSTITGGSSDGRKSRVTADGLTERIFCGFTPCSLYENQLLVEADLEDSEAGVAGWYCNACNIEVDTDSYDGNGFIISGRSKVWAGLTQLLDLTTKPSAESLTTGFYFKLNGEVTTDISVMPKLKIHKSDGSFFWVSFSTYLITVEEQGDWHEITDTQMIVETDFDWNDVTIARYYLQLSDATVSYKVDLVFLADTATLPAIELDEKSVALNYDFEMDVESIFSSGWNSKSGQDFKLLNVIDSNSPSGYQHLQVLPAAEGIKYDITDQVDIANPLEVIYFSKFTGYQDHIDMKVQIVATFDSATATNKKQYLSCGAGCMVPNTDWQQLSGTCYIQEEIMALEELAVGDFVITKLEFMIFSTTTTAATLYFDKIQIRPYEHRRSEWMDAANQRITEYRTTPVKINVENCEKCAKIQVKMTKNQFPFGATYSKHIYNDETNSRHQWKELFNYGAPANELKWIGNEWTEGKPNFEYADLMIDLFNQWEVAYRGHVFFWGVLDGLRTPAWFRENPTIEAMYQRMSDAASRYAGEIESWDVFNEILHDNDFFQELFGDDIMVKMLAEYRRLDPTGKAAINDYELLRSDKGRCFVDKVKDLDLDELGLQSHMFSAFNGDAVYQRIEELDTLGHELRVTEFDVNEPNHVRKAEDIENFMRIAFSHKSITGINLWAWLKIGTSQDEWDKSMWEGEFGDEAVARPDVCEAGDLLCDYPFNPNHGGLRWLELVKSEWNSSQIIQMEHNADNFDLFHGNYEITLLDENDDVIDSQNVSIESAKCDLFGESNLLLNGDFESMEDWTVNPSSFTADSWRDPKIEPGIVKNGLYIYASNLEIAVLQKLNTPLITGTIYHVQFSNKFIETNSVTTGIQLLDSDGQDIIYDDVTSNTSGPFSGDFDESKWMTSQLYFTATGNEDSIMMVIHGGTSAGGDAIFDHAYLVSDDDYQKCRQDVNFVFDNECSQKTDDCHKFAKCTDLTIGFSCVCKSGYIGDGKNCVEDYSLPEEINALSLLDQLASRSTSCISTIQSEKNISNVKSIEKNFANFDKITRKYLEKYHYTKFVVEQKERTIDSCSCLGDAADAYINFFNDLVADLDLANRKKNIIAGKVIKLKKILNKKADCGFDV